MSDKSAIEWTDATWNPTTGCTKISPGCANCYIERTPAFRIHGRKFVRGDVPLQRHADRLEQPLHWKRPRRVFVNSLSDLFHEDVPDAFIDDVWDIMQRCPQHTFQILTKRPARMKAYFATICAEFAAKAGDGFELVPAPNVWLGVSVENQHFADERIPLLLQTPAAVRFISAEPLLGPVDLANLVGDDMAPDLPGLDWVIVGGESGPGARRFDLAWARSIVDQCQTARVPCFVKQLGAVPTNAILGPVNPVNLRTVGAIKDRKGGDPDEWPEDLRVREFPAVRA